MEKATGLFAGMEKNNKITKHISELRNWEENPRNINAKDFERLKGQIKKLGQYKPLLVTKDGEVIGGNMRLRAYKELGITDIWVSIVEPKDENEKLEYALSDNDRAGYYDSDMLANLIPNYDIDWSQYAVDLKPPEDIQKLINNITPVQEDDAPEVSKDPAVSQLGEVYQLGRHRLMCGDATSLDNVKGLMNGQKADMVFTDPPYLMGFTGNVHGDGSKSHNAVHGAIMNDKMTKEEGDQFIYDMFTTIKAFNKGAYYVCFYRLGLNYIFRALDKHNNDYKALIIWDKGNHTLSNSDYMSRYEPIVYGWFNDHKFYGGRSNFDIWHIDRTAKNDLHPTMKPVALCANAISNSSVADDIILDLFGGSGSTLIACEQTNRICYMMELDPKYCDVIRKRYAKFIGKEDVWEQTTPLIV